MNARFQIFIRRVLKSAAEIDVMESGSRVYRLTVPATDAPAYLRDVVHQFRHSGKVAICH